MINGGEPPENEETFGDESVSFPDADETTKVTIVAGEVKMATFGLLAGIVVCLVGAVLVIFGFTGTFSLVFSNSTTKGQVTTGSIGVVFLLAGVAIIWITRYNVKVGT